jgi:hypothetical protein
MAISSLVRERLRRWLLEDDGPKPAEAPAARAAVAEEAPPETDAVTELRQAQAQHLQKLERLLADGRRPILQRARENRKQRERKWYADHATDTADELFS